MNTPLYRPFLFGREKKYVGQCLDSTWISSKGEFISRFERSFAAYVGSPEAVSVCNGTAALHLALKALGLGPGDEVIVPTLTYIAAANMVAQTGARPVFADSHEDTWQMNPEDVRRRITPRTKAILAVHLYGLPCDMDALLALCREHHLYLVEDCAEAFGTFYKGKHVGTFGDTAAFSFFGNKTITTGEGGMVLARDPQLLKTMFHLKTQGVSPDREYWHDVQGYNYRMTNLCAAIGLAQMEQIQEIIFLKQRLAAWYHEKLAGLPLVMHVSVPETQTAYWMYSILTQDSATRDALRQHLEQAGIETRPFFHPAHTLPIYAEAERYPVAEGLSQRGMNLPSWPALREQDVDGIVSEIRRFYGKVSAPSPLSRLLAT